MERGAELDWEYLHRSVLPEEFAWLETVRGSTDEQLVHQLPSK